jgi:hypothetical protein
VAAKIICVAPIATRAKILFLGNVFLRVGNTTPACLGIFTRLLSRVGAGASEMRRRVIPRADLVSSAYSSSPARRSIAPNISCLFALALVSFSFIGLKNFTAASDEGQLACQKLLLAE